MGGAVFPPLLFTWGQTMVGVMKIMATSFKRAHAGNAALNASNPFIYIYISHKNNYDKNNKLFKQHNLKEH